MDTDVMQKPEPKIRVNPCKSVAKIFFFTEFF